MNEADLTILGILVGIGLICFIVSLTKSFFAPIPQDTLTPEEYAVILPNLRQMDKNLKKEIKQLKGK